MLPGGSVPGLHLHCGIKLFLPESGGSRAELADHFGFQDPQFAAGDDEEVAAAAGGVEETPLARLFLKTPKAGAAAAVLAGLEAIELGPQVVHEQRFEQLEDVLLGGVVRALGAASAGQGR